MVLPQNIGKSGFRIPGIVTRYWKMERQEFLSLEQEKKIKMMFKNIQV